MADIIYNAWDEEWISLENKAFNDGDVWAQLSRAYAYAMETIYGASPVESIELYNLGVTPHPQPADYTPSSKSPIRQFADYFTTIYSNLNAMFSSQPITPVGETGSWYWGEPGTEADPSIIVLPDSWDSNNYYFTLRERWATAIQNFRDTFDKLQFIYKREDVIIFCGHSQEAILYPERTSGGFNILQSIWDDHIPVGKPLSAGDNLVLGNALRFWCSYPSYLNPMYYKGSSYRKLKVWMTYPIGGTSTEVDITINTLSGTLTQSSPSVIFDMSALSELPSYVPLGDMEYFLSGPDSFGYYVEGYKYLNDEYFTVNITIR